MPCVNGSGHGERRKVHENMITPDDRRRANAMAVGTTWEEDGLRCCIAPCPLAPSHGGGPYDEGSKIVNAIWEHNGSRRKPRWRCTFFDDLEPLDQLCKSSYAKAFPRLSVGCPSEPRRLVHCQARKRRGDGVRQQERPRH